MVFFLLRSFYIGIFVQIREQRPKIYLCTKFQPNWKKDIGAWISASTYTDNWLMTSHLCHSDYIIKLFKLLRDFDQDYNHAKFDGIWTLNNGDTKCHPQSIFYQN